MISSSADFFFLSRNSEAEDGSFLLAVVPVDAFRALAPRRELREVARDSMFRESHRNIVVSVRWLLKEPRLGRTYLGFEGPATHEDTAILKATEKHIIPFKKL